MHGWPVQRERDLIELALRSAGECDVDTWPARDHEIGFGTPLEVPVSWSDRLTVGNEAALATTNATAVVSLSRIGRAEDRGTEKHAQAWLVDSDDPSSHTDLALGLHDAADAVEELVREGETVFLHCVYAHHRTPSVALFHAMKYGGLRERDAVEAVREALGRTISTICCGDRTGGGDAICTVT